MLSTRIRGQIMPTRNKPQKINMSVTTSQYKTSGKNNAYLLSHNLPAGEKFIGTSSILEGGESLVLPPDPLFTHCICQVLTGTAVIFHRRLARPPICLSFK